MSAIGIVGGVGPGAGVDLARKIFSHTKATRDQDHINLFLTSCPALIPDRTAFLLDGGEDPVPGIRKCIEILEQCGATAVGIACNTAHSPQILDRLEVPPSVCLVNMIDETCRFILKKAGEEGIGRAGNREKSGTKIRTGLLGTLGTIRTGVYNYYCSRYPEIELVVPPADVCEAVHRAVYDAEQGIKALSSVSDFADRTVREAVGVLADMGCSAVILGCTELPLVFGNEVLCNGVFLVDATDILAQALILRTEPEKLR